MNKFTILPLIVFATALSVSAQVDFRRIETEAEIDSIFAEAKEKNLPVFVDVYATWCGPCKWMDANVFALPAAGDYMNEAFINVKLDGETAFGRIFSLRHKLTAYPSFFIFNQEENLMNNLVGSKPWEELHAAITSTLEYYPVLEVLKSKFESQLLSKEEYPKLITALREMRKLDYAELVVRMYKQEYLSKDKYTENDLKVLAYFTKQGTRTWDTMLDDIPLLKKSLGEDLENFNEEMLNAAIMNAVEENKESYLTDYHSMLPDLTEGTNQDAEEMKTRSYIYYYHYSGKFNELGQYIDTTYTNEKEGDHEWLFNAASNAVFLDPRNIQMAQKGVEWFTTCVGLKETHEYYYTLALTQYFTGSPTKTLESLKKALEFTEDPELIMNTLEVIKQVEEEL